MAGEATAGDTRALHTPRDSAPPLAGARRAAVLPDVIVRYGLDGRATYCSQDIDTQVAVSARRIVGLRHSESAPPGMRGMAEYERQLRHTLDTGEAGQAELQVPHPDGTLRVHGVVFAAERDAEGRVTGAIAIGRDVTEQTELRDALEAKEREFRTLAENSPDVIVRYDVELRMAYCNAAFERHTGVPKWRAIGRRAMETLPRGRTGTQDYLEQLAQTLATGRAGTAQLLAPDGHGGTVFHHVQFFAERDEAGVIRGAVAVGRDLTEQVRAAQALAAKEREFRSLAENAVDNIVRWDANALVTYVNPAFLRFVGRPAEVILGQSAAELAGGGDTALIDRTVRRVLRQGTPEMLELHLRRPRGGQQVHQVRFVPEREESGRVTGVLAIGRDVTEQVAYRERIEALVRTDPLTGLPNRQALVERAPALLAGTRRHGHHAAVLLLDLDRFKRVKHDHGQAAADAVLREAAQRLGQCLRANDLLVRQGDDEFVVIAPDIDNAESVGGIADKLQRALAQPMPALEGLRDRTFECSASVGVAIFPTDGAELDALLAHAASALQHAKQQGRGRTVYYRQELGEAVHRRLLIENRMALAAAGEGLRLYLQPIVDLRAGGRIAGAEALLRWEHPDLGLLAPDAFIPVAEDNGRIVAMGEWVLRSAAQTAVRCNRNRTRPLHVAVNVSTRQLTEGDFGATVRQVLAETGCLPGWLTLEITESALLEPSPQVHEAFAALRTLGVTVALDDFGTGYSALNYLSRFPVDCLKIDKSFVHGIGRSAREAELVRAFVAMASALKLDLVAEGVETPAQQEFLHALDCGRAQGWLYGRPMPAGQFEALVAGNG